LVHCLHCKVEAPKTNIISIFNKLDYFFNVLIFPLKTIWELQFNPSLSGHFFSFFWLFMNSFLKCDRGTIFY
jgi:Ni/Fe-hydrogenase subunit HybB-like protein